MPKVTYLFGAGASCHCLPMIGEIPACLNDLFHLFSNYPPPPDQGAKTRLHNMIIGDLTELKTNAAEHSSVDTYIKKLFITAKGKITDKLIASKVLLSFSFIYEQIRNPTDPRYDTFFASILKNHELDFNGDIRIVSWNYDYQFEKAYGLYSGLNSLAENQGKLRVVPSVPTIPTFGDMFTIYKLNGTTAFYDSQIPGIVHPLDDMSIGANKRDGELPGGIIRQPIPIPKDLESKLVSIFTDYYFKSLNRTLFPMLSFAWENMVEGSFNPKIISSCINATAHTKALVVIGYSFPFFNREVDKTILSHLGVEYPIYIQDPKFSEVVSNLRSVLPKNHAHPFIQVNNMKQFFLPGEL